MKNYIRKFLKVLLGIKRFENTRAWLNQKILTYYYLKVYFSDFKLFLKHSTVFNIDNYEKVESKIILHYHSLEKGFLYEKIKFRFGKAKITELIEMLKRPLVAQQFHKSQIQAALAVLCHYYHFHKQNRIVISDYFPDKDYTYFKEKLIIKNSPVNIDLYSDIFSSSQKDFKIFSSSRHSVREYTGEIIPYEKVMAAIDIAKNAPSVCNRQASKVYLVEKSEWVKEVLEIQGGLKGFTDNINQLLVLTNDRSYYYAIGERNQTYIDGGAFLMNLLYALHYYGIAACPAHWAYENKVDFGVQNLLGIKESEKIICIITIGMPPKEIKTTLSYRRENDEILIRK